MKRDLVDFKIESTDIGWIPGELQDWVYIARGEWMKKYPDDDDIYPVVYGGGSYVTIRMDREDAVAFRLKFKL